MRKTLITSLLIFLFLSVYSQDQSSEKQNALIFFELNYPDGSSPADGFSIDTSFVYRNLTIVNFSSPGGFVILRSLPEGTDVIGYSWDNHFSFEADTTGFIETWADVLSESTELPGYAPEKAIPRLKTGRLPVEPLVQTAWNQGWPYNYYCPVDPEADQRTLVGCVAVAVGQIIRYYDKWNNFQIQHSYEHEVYGELSCIAGNYNWLGMENHPLGINNEVARLLYHSGVLVNMGYGISGSGASSGNAAGLFNRIYEGGSLNDSPYGNPDDFYNSISRYKPIYSTYEGHAFVCDGFDGNNYYHFNLGWGGSANGFYPLSNVLGKTLLSAIFNTAPSDSLPPPKSFRKNILSDAEVEISWNGPEGDRSGLNGYSIYLDDIFFDETSDTVYIHECQPGSHYLRVTANYSTGESRWIGPASYFSNGDEIPIADEKLRIAMNTSIGVPSSQRSTHVPTRGELYDVKHLNITNADDLTGIANCPNLQQLILLSSSTNSEIDLSEIQECQGITLLRISNYKLLNTAAVSSLVKMQELRLSNNSLDNLDFLRSMKELYKIEIIGNPVLDIEFLNDLQRLTWISMPGCGIQSFEELDNTYGVEYIDVSDNLLTDISWLNGNRSLRHLDAGGNQLEGEINIDGLSLLKNLSLNQNQVSKLNISNCPVIKKINLEDNKIRDIKAIVSGNKLLEELDVSGNLVDSLPAVASKILKLDLGKNLIFDLVPVQHYGSMLDLDLFNNRIADLSPLLFKSYADRLDRVNLRDNPISKESYLVHRPRISQAAGSAYFPSRYYPGSPCYLHPSGDSVVMDRTVDLNWEGDYNDQGYVYDVFLSIEGEAYSLIAEGLAERNFETELGVSGNYSWYVVARLDTDSLHSGYAKFKVFSGFAIPFFEDFEIYTPGATLCSQSPYWRIYGEDQVASKDAYVVNVRAYEGKNSIKVAGATDLLFPVSEYLSGYCETSFRIMVDQNRQGTIKTLLRDGTTVDFYFYSAGICEVYHGPTRIKFFSYQARNWMEMEIISDPSRGLKWSLDKQGIFEISDVQPIEGIRFCTLDGPGYFDSAPTVLYVDNFAISKGVLLSTDYLAGSDLDCRAWLDGEVLTVTGSQDKIRFIDILNVNGQVIQRIEPDNTPGTDLRIPVASDENVIIVVIHTENNRRIIRKLVNLLY